MMNKIIRILVHRNMCTSMNIHMPSKTTKFSGESDMAE